MRKRACLLCRSFPQAPFLPHPTLTPLSPPQSAGWQCRWVNQDLVEGLSPASLSEFYDQRMRWTAGGLQQLFYQGVVVRRVPVKPIWGAEWDEQIKRGVPGMSRSARFAWLPLTVYYVIPISVILYCYLAMLCQIVIDMRDDHVVPLYLGVAVIIIVTFYNFGLAYPLGTFRDTQLSARALYVYLPVFIYALWMLAMGQMNPLRRAPRSARSAPPITGSSESETNHSIYFPEHEFERALERAVSLSSPSPPQESAV